MQYFYTDLPALLARHFFHTVWLLHDLEANSWTKRIRCLYGRTSAIKTLDRALS
jgi:hypothetical protein